MLAVNALQTGSNTLWWLWIVLIVLFLVVVIWWLWSRRRSGQVETTPMDVRPERTVDDLTRIEGIGPKVAKVLSEAGITTFDDLARADPSSVQDALKAAGLQMMSPEGWIEQAALAARGDWAALEKLQAKLKGGRK